MRLVEDMTFQDHTGEPCVARIVFMDEDIVEVEYERTIRDNAGRGGVVYDVENIGMDRFPHEHVQQMLDTKAWTVLSTPAGYRDDDA